MARFAATELACAADGSAAATLDGRLRTMALGAVRRGLVAAFGKDGAAPGACTDCGGRGRLLRREAAEVETVVGRVEMEMSRFACREGGRSWRPRESLLETSYGRADGCCARRRS